MATIQTAIRTTCSRSFIRIMRAWVRPISISARAGWRRPCASRFSGAYPYYSTGDADFADMIVDVFGKAVNQAGFAADLAYSQVQHALACYDFPGTIYKKGYSFPSGPPSSIVLTYDQPNTAGNFILTAISVAGGGPGLISDTAENGWTPLFPSGAAQLWFATAVASPSDIVTISGASGTDANVELFEIGGVDTVDSVVAAPANAFTASITTTNAPGTPAYIFAITTYSGFFSGMDPANPLWPTLLVGSRMLIQHRVV